MLIKEVLKLFLLWLFAFSLSLDALGAGLAYGIKKVSLSISSKLIISLISVFFSYSAVIAAHFLCSVLPKETGNIISIIVLFLLGFYMLISAAADTIKRKTNKVKEYRFILDFVGMTITIVKHPLLGDMDNSKSIDLKEAIYIGIALSLDTIGAGIGYNVSTPSYLYPVAVGLFQFLLISFGEALGRKIKDSSILSETLISFIPGLIMLFLAVWHIIDIL